MHLRMTVACVKGLLKKKRRKWLRFVCPTSKGQCKAVRTPTISATTITGYGVSIKRQKKQYVAYLEAFHLLQDQHEARATVIDHADLLPRLDTESCVLFVPSLFSPKASAGADSIFAHSVEALKCASVLY